MLLPHLEKYGVFDDVAIEDQIGVDVRVSSGRPGGRRDREAMRRPGSGKRRPGARARPNSRASRSALIRESPAGMPGLTLIGDIDSGRLAQGAACSQPASELGLVEAGPDVFEVLRIEAGTPVFGKDITEKNLPQEIGRDDRAINFVKGCYLGQETVARLDALGHVNQILHGLVFEPGSACPPSGATLEDGESASALSLRRHSRRSGTLRSRWRWFAPAMRAPATQAQPSVIPKVRHRSWRRSATSRCSSTRIDPRVAACARPDPTLTLHANYDKTRKPVTADRKCVGWRHVAATVLDRVVDLSG